VHPSDLAHHQRALTLEPGSAAEQRALARIEELREEEEERDRDRADPRATRRRWARTQARAVDHDPLRYTP